MPLSTKETMTLVRDIEWLYRLPVKDYPFSSDNHLFSDNHPVKLCIKSEPGQLL